MAVVAQRNVFSIQCTSNRATVPNNDVSRLMYYLNCVCGALDCKQDSDIQRFIDYDNWHYLSFDEQKQLLDVCYTFSPDVLNDRVFFHSNELCGADCNQFYRINQVSQHLLVADSIVIAGQVRVVNEIMVYTMQWMKSYYIEPMKGLVAKFRNPPQTTTYQPVPTPVVKRYSIASNHGSTCRRVCFICAIAYCMLVALPLFIIIIVGIVNASK